MTGSVRVVPINPRQAPDAMPEPGEVVVRVDRSHPVLGNPHILANKHDAKERQRVIALFEADVQRDWEHHGPLRVAIEALAERVQRGENLCLACHCFPDACHADVIVERIEERQGWRPTPKWWLSQVSRRIHG